MTNPTCRCDTVHTDACSASTDTAAIESLRAFAIAHNELAFAHLCTIALDGSDCGDEVCPDCDATEWARERVAVVVAEVARTKSAYRDEVALNIIRATDTTRPDGAIARSLLAP